MRQLIKLVVIGLIAGTVLAVSMKIVYWAAGSQAYVLLFNYDYIPVMKHWRPILVVGTVFHYIFCIASVVVLFYLLRRFQLEKRLLPYIATYTIGSGMLFFLAALTEKPPAATDAEAWFYWTGAHALYGWMVGLLVKYWIGFELDKKV